MKKEKFSFEQHVKMAQDLKALEVVLFNLSALLQDYYPKSISTLPLQASSKIGKLRCTLEGKLAKEKGTDYFHIYYPKQ